MINYAVTVYTAPSHVLPVSIQDHERLLLVRPLDADRPTGILNYALVWNTDDLAQVVSWCEHLNILPARTFLLLDCGSLAASVYEELTSRQLSASQDRRELTEALSLLEEDL